MGALETKKIASLTDAAEYEIMTYEMKRETDSRRSSPIARAGMRFRRAVKGMR